MGPPNNLCCFITADLLESCRLVSATNVDDNNGQL